MKRLNGTFVIRSDDIRNRAMSFVGELPISETPWEVTIKEHKSKRTIEQNNLMWALLEEVSTQVDWYGQKLSREDWKDIFSASLKQQRVVPGLEGGFVILGAKTSKMKIGEMTAMIDLILAFGHQKDVKFREPETV